MVCSIWLELAKPCSSHSSPNLGYIPWLKLALRNAGVRPVAMMTTTSTAMIVEMLCSTGAIGTVTRQSIEQHMKDGLLEEIEVPIALPDSELSLSYPLTRRNDILRKAVDIVTHSVKGSSGSI